MPAFRYSARSTPIVRWPNARPNCQSPRPSGGNFSTNFTAGSGKAMPFTFSATTTANGSGSRKSGSELVGQCVRLSPSEQFRQAHESKTMAATPVLRYTSARSPAALFVTRRNWSSSPTRKFLAATKSSARAGSNRRTRWRRARRWTLISRIWKKAIWLCICSTASDVFSALKNLPLTSRQSALSQARLPDVAAADVNRRITARSAWSSNTRPPIPAMSRRNFTFPSPNRISSANTSAPAGRIRR